MTTRSGASESRPRARPQRRSNAERSATTREKVIQAVVDCIAEEGLASTTASRIAERSGVTWGAIVHQFGDKDSLLLAVMRRGLERMSQSLHEALAGGASTPEARVSLLVDETWKGLNAPSFRAFLEIVLHGRPGGDAERMSRQEDVVVSLTRGIWSDLFGSFDLDPAAIEVARKLTFASLLGLAIQGMMGPRRPRFARELDTVKHNALHMLDLV
jgi:AcrR family transcriptional regulator